MNITQSEFQYIREHILTQMIQILIEEEHLSLENAMDKVYSSELFEKLSDPETGLYIQSPRYLLSYLKPVNWSMNTATCTDSGRQFCKSSE